MKRATDGLTERFVFTDRGTSGSHDLPVKSYDDVPGAKMGCSLKYVTSYSKQLGTGRGKGELKDCG
jgi:hypothetical protein